MDVAAILKSLEDSGLAARIRESLFLFPMIESTHVIALALVFGTITIIDLRLLGIASTQRPFTRMASDILKWTWAAFILAALTGSLMFITNASVYYHNFYFRTKMALLVLTGINLLVFELTAARTIHGWDKAPSAPPAGKAVAALSLAIWISIIVMGRMIGFTTSRAEVAPPPAGINFDDFLQGTPNDSGGSSTTPHITSEGRLFPDQVRQDGVVFPTDELDQFIVGHQTLVRSYGPRPGIGLGIVHGHFDIESPVVGPADALRHMRFVGHRAAVFIDPRVIQEAGRLHHQRVAFPPSNRVAVPPGLNIVFIGQRTAVCEDLPRASVRLREHHNLARVLNELARLRVKPQLHRVQRQTVGVGMILAVFRQALVAEFQRPWLIR